MDLDKMWAAVGKESTEVYALFEADDRNEARRRAKEEAALVRGYTPKYIRVLRVSPNSYTGFRLVHRTNPAQEHAQKKKEDTQSICSLSLLSRSLSDSNSMVNKALVSGSIAEAYDTFAKECRRAKTSNLISQTTFSYIVSDFGSRSKKKNRDFFSRIVDCEPRLSARPDLVQSLIRDLNPSELDKIITFMENHKQKRWFFKDGGQEIRYRLSYLVGRVREGKEINPHME